MCEPVSIAMAVVGGVSAIAGQKEADKQMGAQVAAQEATKQNMIRTMNYDIASKSQEQRDLYEQAVAQLQANSINSIRNQGMLAAALGETGLEGNSVDRVMREVEGQDARVADSIRGDFSKQFGAAQYNKELDVINAEGALKGIPKITGPSTASRILGVVNGGLSGAQTGMSLKTGLNNLEASRSKATGANTR